MGKYTIVLVALALGGTYAWKTLEEMAPGVHVEAESNRPSPRVAECPEPPRDHPSFDPAVWQAGCWMLGELRRIEEITGQVPPGPGLK